jgi:hypothetical protein
MSTFFPLAPEASCYRTRKNPPNISGRCRLSDVETFLQNKSPENEMQANFRVQVFVETFHLTAPTFFYRKCVLLVLRLKKREKSMKLDPLVGKVNPRGPRLGDFLLQTKNQMPAALWGLLCCPPAGRVPVSLEPSDCWSSTALMMSRSLVWDPGEGQMLNLLPVTIHTRPCVQFEGRTRPPFTFATEKC